MNHAVDRYFGMKHWPHRRNGMDHVPISGMR
jgi:hypothetical protein